MSFPRRTIIDEKILFPPLPSLDVTVPKPRPPGNKKPPKVTPPVVVPCKDGKGQVFGITGETEYRECEKVGQVAKLVKCPDGKVWYNVSKKCIDKTEMTRILNPSTTTEKKIPAVIQKESKPGTVVISSVVKRPKYRKRSVGLLIQTWHDTPGFKRHLVMGEDKYEQNSAYWWAEPAFGFSGYSWGNVKMIDYHIDKWIKLGVDFVFVDLTNGNQKEIVDGAKKLCKRLENVSGPRVVFWIQKKEYVDFYKKNFYDKFSRDLFFNYLGKPLLLIAGISDGWIPTPGKKKPVPTGGVFDNFTIRNCWGLLGNATDSMWSFKDVKPSKPFMRGSVAEHIGVSFASQASFMTSSTDGRQGRQDGKFFASQLPNITKNNPEIVTITGYNEWVSINFGTGGQPKFVDLYLPEYSHDIEPMKGGFGDKYYNIAKNFISSWSPGAYANKSVRADEVKISSSVSKPKLPSWARPPNKWLGGVSGSGYKNHLVNVDTAKQNRAYDVLIYGDSITSGIRDISSVNKEFAKMFTSFATFGAPGNTIEDLVWRIISGNEVLKYQPKTVLLWIGTNNVGLKTGDPVPQMDFLVKTIKSVYPKSNIFIMNALPTAKYDVSKINTGFKKVASANKVTFLTCDSDLNPKDKVLFMDGLHPTVDGYKRIFNCVKKNIKT